MLYSKSFLRQHIGIHSHNEYVKCMPCATRIMLYSSRHIVCYTVPLTCVQLVI